LQRLVLKSSVEVVHDALAALLERRKKGTAVGKESWLSHRRHPGAVEAYYRTGARKAPQSSARRSEATDLGSGSDS